jgi:hypothetical protein
MEMAAIDAPVYRTVNLLLIFIGFIFLSLSACSDHSTKTNNSGAGAEEELNVEDQVAFVVLSKILEESSHPKTTSFISVRKGDPSSALMTTLKERWHDLRPESESYTIKMGDSVRDKSTNEPGVRYEIRELKFIEGDAIVKGGYYASNLSADGCTYNLRLENGQWLITAKTDCWVA